MHKILKYKQHRRKQISQGHVGMSKATKEAVKRKLAKATKEAEPLTLTEEMQVTWFYTIVFVVSLCAYLYWI